MAKSFGEKLRELRMAKGLSQKKAEDLLGLSDRLLCRYENNRTFPRPYQLQKLADFYEVPVKYFFENVKLKKKDALAERIIELEEKVEDLEARLAEFESWKNLVEKIFSEEIGG